MLVNYFSVQTVCRKNVIGIMGGIASGKSTVAKELAKRGCAVINADRIAKQFLKCSQVKRRLRKIFGDSIFDAAGRIRKKKLAEIAFSCSSALKALNAIIHPRVLEKTNKLIGKYQQKPFVKAIVLDMPLLVEVGWHTRCDKLIFVKCSLKSRLQRAKKKGILKPEDLKKRENFQISLDKKKKLAHYIIDNNNLAQMKKQIGKLFPALITKG